MKKRIVLKVGSHVLSEKNELCMQRISALCKLLADLSKKYSVILVSSGAVSAGQSKINLERNSTLNKQILAAIGQPHLMATYESFLNAYGIKTAQILLNGIDFDSKKHSTYAKNVVWGLLELGVLPIVNENDATAIAEIVYGDNDRLSADVAICFEAQLLVMLSDIDGYYDGNPSQNKNAKIRLLVDKIENCELENSAAKTGSEHGTGGITTKLIAAQMVMKEGIDMYLSSGFDLSAVRSFLLDESQSGGTLFVGRK